MTDAIDVRLLESPEDRRAAYTLRYRVFFEGDGDATHADHVARTWKDARDAQRVAVFGAFVGGRLVGTLRGAVRREAEPHDDDHHYQWPELARSLGSDPTYVLAHACVMDRGAVARAYRRRGVMRAMATALFATARARDAAIVVGAAAPTSARVSATLESLGFRAYSGGTHYVRDGR